MPITAFRCPITQNEIPLAEAADYFENEGIAPADVVQAMIDDIASGDHADGIHLSPSKMNPATTCRREVVGERYMGFVEDPFSRWGAMEGTFFHRTMVEAGEGLANWNAKVKLPDRGPNGERVEIEVFPGILLSGEADRISNQLQGEFDLVDHKTSRFTKTDYGPRNIPEWAIQLNLYRYIYEDMTGLQCRALWVWRTYRGSYERTKTFRKFPIPLVSREALWAKIGTWAESLRDYLLAAEAVKNDPEAVKALVSSIPMDGAEKHMLGDQKCSGYCGFYRICFGLAGKVVF